MKKTIKIRISNKNTRTINVEAEKFTIQGFENNQFYVHRRYKDARFWDTSEYVTGCRITWSRFKTKKAAIESCREAIICRGLDKLTAAICNQVKLFGVINECPQATIYLNLSKVIQMPKIIEY